MVDKGLKEAIEDLKDEMSTLKSSIDNLQFTLEQLHEGDRGLRSLVDRIGYLDNTIGELIRTMKQGRRGVVTPETL